MSEIPEALEVADSLKRPQPYAYLVVDEARIHAAVRLLHEQHAEIERLKAALPYDWNMLEACRGSLREHMAEINRLKAERDEAVKAEREACAKVCEEVGNRDAITNAWDAAAAIRARGQEDKT